MIASTKDYIDRYLYAFCIWEPAITRWMQSYLCAGDTFIDVGSHAGYYTLLASRLVGPITELVDVVLSRATL